MFIGSSNRRRNKVNLRRREIRGRIELPRDNFIPNQEDYIHAMKRINKFNKTGIIMELEDIDIAVLSDIRLMMCLIKHCWQIIYYAPFEIIDNELIVKEAIKKDPEAMRYASNRLRNNFTFALECIEIDVRIIKRLDTSLKNDFNFAVTAINLNAHSVMYISPTLRDNMDIAYLALSRDPNVIHKLGPTVLNNIRVVQLALFEVPNLVRLCGENVRGNVEFMTDLIKKEPKVREFACESILHLLPCSA